MEVEVQLKLQLLHFKHNSGWTFTFTCIFTTTSLHGRKVKNLKKKIEQHEQRKWV